MRQPTLSQRDEVWDDLKGNAIKLTTRMERRPRRSIRRRRIWRCISRVRCTRRNAEDGVPYAQLNDIDLKGRPYF